MCCDGNHTLRVNQSMCAFMFVFSSLYFIEFSAIETSLLCCFVQTIQTCLRALVNEAHCEYECMKETEPSILQLTNGSGKYCSHMKIPSCQNNQSLRNHSASLSRQYEEQQHGQTG